LHHQITGQDPAARERKETNMDSHREHSRGPVPLPEFGDSGPADPGSRPASARSGGIRHARRLSNWTAAALIVGTGAATVALAHQAFPAAAPAAGTTSVTAGTGSVATAQGTAGPQATHSVATTSGSGVTVTTTTRTANGKTIVTHVPHAPAYHDN
jgi:hypothetical protein